MELGLSGTLLTPATQPHLRQPHPIQKPCHTGVLEERSCCVLRETAFSDAELRRAISRDDGKGHRNFKVDTPALAEALRT